MVVIIRLDLDRYELDMIERLVVDGLVTIGEAVESRAYRNDIVGDVAKLMWLRSVQKKRLAGMVERIAS
jgi:hypothetical protein